MVLLKHYLCASLHVSVQGDTLPLLNPPGRLYLSQGPPWLLFIQVLHTSPLEQGSSAVRAELEGWCFLPDSSCLTTGKSLIFWSAAFSMGKRS